MGAKRDAAVSFDVPQDWAGSELEALLPSDATAISTSRQLTTVYFDTAGHDLLAAGLTLARCSGAGTDGWRLEGSGRDFTSSSAGGRGVPAQLRALVRGVAAGAALRQVARVRSEQTIHLVPDPAGAPAIEITDAVVAGTVLGSPLVVRTWRTIEVRSVANEADQRAVRALARRLEKAGAERSGAASPLARALDRAPEKRRRPRSLGELITSHLDRQRAVLLETDVELRSGDESVVHRARIAIRRYRSALRVFADLFDGPRAAHLDAELSWYGGALGAVRDRHVLRERLAELRGQLPDDAVVGPVDSRIAALLDAEEQDASRSLARVMAGSRYATLIGELNDWHRNPPLTGPARPLREVGRFVGSAERRAAKRLARARRHDFEVEFSHRARKAVKRARYVAELAEPVLGKQARRTKKHAKHMQQRLGAVQDSAIVLDFLHRAAIRTADGPGENGFSFGFLSAIEASRSQPAADH